MQIKKFERNCFDEVVVVFDISGGDMVLDKQSLLQRIVNLRLRGLDTQVEFLALAEMNRMEGLR